MNLKVSKRFVNSKSLGKERENDAIIFQFQKEKYIGNINLKRQPKEIILIRNSSFWVQSIKTLW